MVKLDKFVKQLEDILGDNLLSVIMFGSQVSVEPENLKSNINLMIVLEHLTSDDLKNISKPTLNNAVIFKVNDGKVERS